jgi:predicted amidohydrolase YtcJ
VRRHLFGRLFPVILISLAVRAATAQVALPPEVAQFGYADTVFFNGKIVSMDDKTTSTEVGHVYQAVAIKNDKIMKLGTSDEVKAVAGPKSRVYDLHGRTLMPGIVEPHNHIYGGSMRYLDRFGYKYPPNGIEVQATAKKDLEGSQLELKKAVEDALKKVTTGQWIVVHMNPFAEDPGLLELWTMTRKFTNRNTLDRYAPQNPVLMIPGLRGTINTQALKLLDEFLPGYSDSIQETMHGDRLDINIPQIGWVGSQEMAVIQWELFLQQVPLNILAQTLKLTSEQFATTGVTTFATRIPFPKVMSGYSTLVGLGQMPIRLDAHYEVHRMPTDPKQTRELYRRTGILQGLGDDYLWIDGVASERWDSFYPESCTGPDTVAPPAIKAREVCPQPGDLMWDTLENAMKAGWRVAGVHICGSESARSFFKMIDRARAVNGWSMEDVRNLHMTGEHCNLIGKDPKMIQQLKDYGMILSCGPDIVQESPHWIEDYGPQIEKFIEPFNTWIKSGVKLVGQHYGTGAERVGRRNFQPPFFMVWQAVTRKYDGKVWQPDERVNRVHAIKMYTSWASEYVRKPEKLGTLEVGKLADMIVLDRDYFTVPEDDDILKVKPLMTMVGGKMVVLQAALAKDFGIDTVGPAYTFTDANVDHIGHPQTEISKKFPNEQQRPPGE